MLKKWLGIDKLESRLEQVLTEKSQIERENQDLAAKLEALKQELVDVKKSPKEIATEAGQPWVDVIRTGFDDPKSPGSGYFEIDWNRYFVEQLVEAGYSGRTEEEIIDMWFNDICHGVVNGG